VSVTASSGLRPLHKAVQNKNFGLVELLLVNNANVDAEDSLSGTPLHDAAWNSAQLTEVLLYRGANINARTIYLRTPLHIACSNNKSDCIEVLVRRGAELNGKDVNGGTPLDLYLSTSTNPPEVGASMAYHGALCGLEINYPRVQNMVFHEKFRISEKWPRNFGNLPPKWKIVVWEWLFVVEEMRRMGLGLPRELCMLVAEKIILVFPVKIRLKE